MTVETKFADFFSKNARIFMEMGLDGLTDWFQIIPAPGSFTHPMYGKVVIDEGDLQEFVENFKANIYQAHIPIDAEHQSKLSGALAYFKELKVGENNSGVYARAELTERGKKLLNDGGFRYFSPEFYSLWKDPATDEVHRNVLTGGAFTTKPFFKDKALKPVMMSELLEVQQYTHLDVGDVHVDELIDEEDEEDEPTKKKVVQNKEKTMSDKTDEKTVEATPDNSAEYERKFSELSTQNESLVGQLRSMSEANAALMTRVEKMESDDRQRRFSEMVMGRGGENDGNPWPGGVEKHVPFLEKLAKTFGEESEDFKQYISIQNEQAKILGESKLFTEVGVTSKESPAAQAASGSIEAETKKFAEANSISEAEALPRVLAANPKLYAEYNKQHMRRAQSSSPRQDD